MKTSTLVNGQGITGNIGSCTTQVARIETGRDLLTVYVQNIATNSCTGEVTKYDTWGVSGFSVLLCIVVTVFFIMIIAIVKESNERGWNSIRD